MSQGRRVLPNVFFYQEIAPKEMNRHTAKTAGVSIRPHARVTELWLDLNAAYVGNARHAP